MKRIDGFVTAVPAANEAACSAHAAEAAESFDSVTGVESRELRDDTRTILGGFTTISEERA